MVKRNYDDLIITIGALVLGWGLYNLLTKQTYAYAVVAPPCAAACAPFKSSPATYATCCKQHAATAAAKPKPVAPTVPTGFRTATIKSKLPKPLSVTQLHQGQVQRVDDITSKNNLLTQKLRNLMNGNDPPATQVPSGGGGKVDNGKQFKEIRCQTGCNQQCGKGGCDSKRSPRLQFGVYNESPEVDFNVTVKIPQTWTGADTATLQVGGVAHHDGCSTDGYKAYVGINGGKNGIGTETGTEKTYTDLGAKCNPNVGNLQPGQTYRLRALKRNVGSSVQVSTWVNGQPHCSVTHAQGILGRKFISKDCPAVDQLRVDGWPDQDLSNAISVSSGPPS